MISKAKRSSKKVPRPKAKQKIWLMAVDPFAGFDLRPTLNFAQSMAEKSGAKIHVAYVLAPASLNWSGDFSGPWMRKYQPIAMAKLDQILADLDWPREIVPCARSGLKESVKSLLKYCAKKKVDSILISTHARRGIERFALGSFAESLIQTSPIPVLLTNPVKSVPKQVRRILVPTDLAKNSQKVILGMAKFALDMDAEMILYYKQPDPLDPIIQQGVYSLGGGWISMQTYMNDELKGKSKMMAKIEESIRKLGVPVRHVLDSSPGDLIDGIQRTAKEEDADIICLRTEAGTWTSTIMGSVARGLVREATLPLRVQRA